ncbi:MAG: TonB family protein [Acidobacteriaceae bacterium]
MIELHRVLLTYLLNSVWQVPAIALAALLCSLLLRKTSAIVQHRLWAITLIASATVPLVTTSGWLAVRWESLHAHPKTSSAITLLLDSGSYAGPASSHRGDMFALPTLANLLLFAWIAFVCYRAASLLWAWRRALSLVDRSGCASIPPAVDQLWSAAQARFHLVKPQILFSDQISAPATLHARGPILLLPTSIRSRASEAEFAAIFAHEAAHIHRLDFFLNIFYEVLALPVAYHPVALFLRSRITETRELVCDHLAAESLGDAPAYARSLVHIAESLSGPAPLPIHALGIFEGRNLEKRIMTLIDRTPRLSRWSTASLVVLCSLLFASCCLAATTFNFQPAAVVSDDLKPYAGSWQWMFQGKPFVTMTLVPQGDHFTGSMTNGRFSNNENGDMTDAASRPGSSPILRTFFVGKALHIVVQDTDKSLSEWSMILLSPNQAQFSTADPDAPKNLKPWLANHVSAEPTAAGTDQNGQPVYLVGGPIAAPKLLSHPAPVFPAGHSGKFAGTCVVAAIVDTQGVPQSVRIVRALGSDFDQSALEAVKRYRFAPFTRNGVPVPVALKIEVNFRRY